MLKLQKWFFCVLLINVTQKATGTLNCCYCYPLSFSIVYLHPRHKHLFLQGYLPIHAFWQFHAQIVEEVNGIQCSRASVWLSPCLHWTRAAWRDTTKYNRTHYNQWCCVTDYTGCGAAQQIPASKVMPCSIYDVQTQSRNDLQWLFCRVQCRQTFGPFTWCE